MSSDETPNNFLKLFSHHNDLDYFLNHNFANSQIVLCNIYDKDLNLISKTIQSYNFILCTILNKMTVDKIILLCTFKVIINYNLSHFSSYHYITGENFNFSIQYKKAYETIVEIIKLCNYNKFKIELCVNINGRNTNDKSKQKLIYYSTL